MRMHSCLKCLGASKCSLWNLLGSEPQNLFQKFQAVLKIKQKCRLNFHKMESEIQTY